MGGKVEACAECTKKCLLVHRNKAKLSPVIHSFFKIMIGKDCSEILFLPPKFAEMVSAVIGKKAVIEDSSGDCWEVSVSNVDGSPAFRQGWNAFSAYHRLEIGDFLVFDYIRGSRFIVKIFDKTGCEKQKISLTMNKRKRYRTRTNFTDREGQCYTADTGNNCGTAIRDKMKDGDDYSHHADASLISEFEDVLVNKYLVDKEIPNRVAASHASDMDIMKNNGVEKTEQIISRVELQKDGGNNSNVSSGVSQKCHGAEEESKALSRNLPQLIKVERGLRYDMIGREYGISQVVKTETLDLVPTSYIPCATPSDGQPFLELSTCLPTSSFRGRSRTQRKVVVLRDPDMRMWPVLYHERSGFKVLTSGWEAFSKANNIQPGDGCIFGVESYSESIYGVSIVRKHLLRRCLSTVLPNYIINSLRK
ncbi:hypothetical protein CISIN_1g048609mg [Citrus sinensis]|uniref:TF-B3 domain-containing protein n=1 Tax=Citrus sinensis TaxID=2711 RepID=A0A067G0W3_CITSI|nr:hypothetical protein CISIN_1g048609mg [Citrus sinensis]